MSAINKPPIEKSSLLRRAFYSIVFFSLLTVGCYSSSAQITQCTPPKNLPLANDAPAQNIWEGKSGDYGILWTTDNITATDNRTRGVRFLLDKFAFRKTIEELGEPAEWYCNWEDYRRDYRILSLVGNLMSLEETEISSPQTYLTVKYRTVNLSDETKTPLLTDYFSAREVFKELSENPIIKAAIKRRSQELYEGKGGKFSPKNIDEFFKFFDCSAAEKQDGQKSCGMVRFTGDEYSGIFEKSNALNISIKKDLLNNFAFEDLKNGKVTVELLIPALTGNRNEEGYPITLQFKTNSILKNALSKAALRQDGFLLKDKNSVWKKVEEYWFLSANITLASNR